MHSFVLKKQISEKTLLPCYFFYGEETYLAYQFVEELKDLLISPEDQDSNVERVSLVDTSWMDIMDLARTIPFFFSSRRILVVEIPQIKGERLSDAENNVLSDYFRSQPEHSVLILIFQGKLRRDAPLLKFFSAYPHQVITKELKSLRNRALYGWMEQKFSSWGYSVTLEAKARLEELVGNDLARLNNEIEKIMTFQDEKKSVDRDDVDQVSGRIKFFVEWEVKDSLEKADYKRCLLAYENLFNEGNKPEYILGLTASFFREVFLAKVLLREREKEKKDIFRELRPQISERYGSFYTRKFREFFRLIESIPMENLEHFFNELEQIDLKIKTTDAIPKTLFEGFLYDYCRIRREGRIILQEKD